MNRQLVRCFVILALFAVPLAAQKKSPVNGQWEVKVGTETYRFTFAEDQGDVDGTVALPNGKTGDITYGLIVAGDLEFSTEENGVEYEWTAEVSKTGMKGERLNLDTDQTASFRGKKTK